jgi:hypothetical protein
MKVKIGSDLIFDPDEVMIAIYLTPHEREQIANMDEHAMIYCQYPETDDPEVAEAKLQEFRQQMEQEDYEQPGGQD